MRNAGLEEAQSGIKIAERNSNNLRYADDTILIRRKLRGTIESLDKDEREWKSWLKTQYSKTKIMVFSPTTSWQIDGKTMETVRFYFLGLQNHSGW